MVANPDVIDRRIPTYCNGCGNDLSGTAAELVGKRQVIDIPPIVPAATSWQSGEMKRSEFVNT